MKLSPNFELSEFTKSLTALRYGIKNTIPNYAIENLKRLVTQVLQPAREQLDCPIVVNSGYRTPELNRMVKGVPNSLHTYGRAADIRPKNPELLPDLFEILNRLPHTELIYYSDQYFIHVAL